MAFLLVLGLALGGLTFALLYGGSNGQRAASVSLACRIFASKLEVRISPAAAMRPLWLIGTTLLSADADGLGGGLRE